MTTDMQRRHLILTTLAVSAALTLSACSPAAPPEWQVSLDEARQLLERGDAVVFDIREPDEHATGVAQGMRLLPVSQLDKRVSEIPKDSGQPVLIICNTQNRSSKVVEALREAGWTNVRFVNGGMSEWAKRGWPMFKPMG
jgi:rhodanese-related sulfurtransferase